MKFTPIQKLAFLILRGGNFSGTIMLQFKVNYYKIKQSILIYSIPVFEKKEKVKAAEGKEEEGKENEKKNRTDVFIIKKCQLKAGR